MLIFDQLKRSDLPLRNLAAVIAAGLLLLMAGLWYVQVVSSKRFVESERDQSFRTVRIPAMRGKILDRNGVALAENRANYNLSLYLDELHLPFQERFRQLVPRGTHLTKKQREFYELQARYDVASNVVRQVSAFLHEPLALETAEFHRHYELRRVLPLPIIQNLDSTRIARFEEQPLNPPGVDVDIQPIRVYPFGLMAAHLLGQLTRDDSSATDEEAFFNYRLQDYRGVLGLEGHFDSELRGHAGIKSVQVNRLGYRTAESIWTPAEPGKNLILTIDRDIQLAAFQAMRTDLFGTNTRGAAVVVNVRNGDILALVSAPEFDPNQFVHGLTTQDMQRLSDPKLMPQINRATQGQYQPGSIFKIVTALAALEAGVLRTNEIYTNLPDPADPAHGYIMVGRGKIKDLSPPGDYDFRRAFLKSSNSYFIKYGMEARLETLLQIGHRFFLGEACGLPLPGQDKRGFFPTEEWIADEAVEGRRWTDGNTANMCIGQDRLTVTPMQMAMMTAAIANGGKVLWPRLVQRIEPQDPALNEQEIVAFPSRVRGDLHVQPVNLQIIRDAMLADVEDAEGTGKAAYIPGFRICGKTGTAQVKQGGVIKDHITWFASFAPYESPRYAVLVMIESGGSGGGTCAPVAKKIYQEIIRREAQPALPRKTLALARGNEVLF
jgi:penicillin-binding protein 2